jgi:WD40 repeat protein
MKVTLESKPISLSATSYKSIPAGAINHVDRLSAHTDTINDFAISTDGTRMLSGGRDGNLYLWDLATHEIVSRFRTWGIVSAVALSSDGTRAGVAYYDGRMRLFDLRGNIVSQPIGYAWEQSLHTKPIESVDFSADGMKLISTSQDSHAIVWDAETGVVVHDLPTRRHCYSGSLVSRFRNEVVIPSVQERLIVRDMDTGKEVKAFMCLK